MQANASRRDLAKAFVFMAAASAAAPALAQTAAGGDIDAAVKAAHAQYKTLNEGKNADYIPALAQVPSHYFGIGLVTPTNKSSFVGDIEPKFSIQSISKVFTMALVFQKSGEA